MNMVVCNQFAPKRTQCDRAHAQTETATKGGGAQYDLQRYGGDHRLACGYPVLHSPWLALPTHREMFG